MATDDRDMPAEAAESGRDDMPAGPPVAQTDNDSSLSTPAGGQPEPAAEPVTPAGEQADGHQDDDFEPYLPPGPNPFSSVNPQGAPPYRPAAALPGLAPEPPTAGPGAGPGHDAADEPGPVPGPLANGAGTNGPAPDPRDVTEPEYRGAEARPLGAEPGPEGFAEHGYPPVSPYPPLPDEELPAGRPGEATHGGASRGGASPYPAYRPYGPEDDVTGDALADYGLPSPQSYGFAPPPPPVEPLPELGAPGQGYRNEPYEPRGHRDEAPEDEERAVPPAERGGPSGGYGRTPGATGQHHPVAAENGLRGAGLRGGPAPAGAPPARGPHPPAPARGPQPSAMPPSRAAPGRGAAGRGYPPPGGAPSGPLPPEAVPLGASVPRGSRGAHGPQVDGEDLSPLAADAETAQEHETADSLTAEALLHARRPAPGSGWRRTVFRATGGLVRVGESARSQRRRELIWRARTPVAGGHHRVAVMSLKGGVGKTTTTVGLGATLATLRGDRVIAVDANPDRGTLSDKVRLETSATVRDLLNERRQVHRYADVRAFTSQASSRLEVLASDRDPGVSVAFSDDDYCDVARVLEHYYSICITDCGTGLLHSAMTGVLNLADQIVLVSSPSVDGARSASATLDWLDAHDYGDLVRNAVVVVSTVRPRSKSTVDLDRLEQHFAARCRAVVRVPYDAHLEEGAEVELEQLSPATTEAYLGLAATVGDGFAWPRRALQRAAPAHP